LFYSWQKKKRIIEDHFTPDDEIIKQLNSINKNYYTKDLQDFFKKIEHSNFLEIFFMTHELIFSKVFLNTILNCLRLSLA